MHSILVIDDEIDVRAVDSAAEATVEFTQVLAEVVICDIVMPTRSGVDDIRDILSEYPIMRMVAISGGS